MLLTTQGLVLHTTRYAETSIIAKIFTRELGLRSYMVKGVRSVNGRTKQNLLQPLTYLDLTVYNNPRHQIQYVKEMHPAAHQSGYDGVSMALVFFMDEVLYKSLKEEEPNQPLFDYVVGELQSLDKHRNSSFPINFLLHTARHLGIEPMDNYSVREPLFNLKEGRFQAVPTAYTAATNPNIDYFLDSTASSHLHNYLNSCHNHCQQPLLDSKQRRSTLDNLLEYYHIHFSDFNNFKSHEILHSVLR